MTGQPPSITGAAGGGFPEACPADTGALRRQVLALTESCRAAESALQEKSLLLATVSHEIREPMNGVIGMARLLLETPLSGQQKEFVEAVYDSGQALLTIINDVLDLSRMEAGRLELDSIDFDLPKLLERVRAIVEPSAATKALRLVVEVGPEVPRVLHGDPGRLRQILLNLLGNAVKFTETGEVRLSVRLMEEALDRVRLQVVVRDTGIGIPEHLQSRLFSPFGQADRSIQRLYGGSGLGLMICKRLLDLMGGEIALSSRPGEGATFELSIWLERQAYERAAPVRAAAEVAGLVLLIVDPNMTTRQMMEQQTRSWGIEPEVATTGEAAMAALRRAAGRGRPVEVVLVDRSLPDMSGEELGRRIKAEATLQPVELIMIASSGLRGDAARVTSIGFAAYLPKPVAASTLLDCLLELRARPEEAGGEAALITVHSMSEQRQAGLRILLADDNPVNCRLAGIMLEKAGHRIDVVADGAAAVEAAAGHDYDLILMDVQMPGVDGLAATRQIRMLSGPRASVPVVAITANAMHGDDARCLEAGMNDYITKPIDRARLLGKVNQWGGARSA